MRNCRHGWTAAALLLATSAWTPAANFEDSSRWSSTALSGSGLQQGDPTEILWSFVPDGTNIPQQGNNPSTLISDYDAAYGVQLVDQTTDLTTRPWWAVFDELFSRTSELTGATFIYEPSDDGAIWNGANGINGVRGDVRIGGFQGDPFFTANNAAPGGGSGGNMVINSGWANLHNADGLRSVAGREHVIGLGLGLVNVPGINVQAEAGGRTQFDDLYALQRLYGDALEKGPGNDSLATATTLGSLGTSGTAARGVDTDDETIDVAQADFIGIDGASDEDWFRFTVDAGTAATVRVEPRGPTYTFTPEGGVETLLIATEQSDLEFEVYNAQGHRLVSHNDSGLGMTEALGGLRLRHAGDYFVRVRGTEDQQQFYRVDVTASAIPAPSDPRLIFRDNFNTADTSNLNDFRLPSRQGDSVLDSPLLPGSTDPDFTEAVIEGNRLKISSTGDGDGANRGFVDLQRNFGTELVGEHWSIAFDLEMQESAPITDSWFALTMNDSLPIGQPFDASAEMSMLVRTDGRYSLRENGGNNAGEANETGTTGVSATRIEFQVDETGVAPLIDILIDGIVVLDDEEISFSSDERLFSLRTHVSPNAANVGLTFSAWVDNLEINLLGPDQTPGDYDSDGAVTTADYAVWRDTVGSTSYLAANGDNTGASQGVIDLADYDVWASQFGQPLPAAATTAVPEPTSLLLGLPLLAVISPLRRRAAALS